MQPYAFLLWPYNPYLPILSSLAIQWKDKLPSNLTLYTRICFPQNTLSKDSPNSSSSSNISASQSPTHTNLTTFLPLLDSPEHPYLQGSKPSTNTLLSLDWKSKKGSLEGLLETGLLMVCIITWSKKTLISLKSSKRPFTFLSLKPSSVYVSSFSTPSRTTSTTSPQSQRRNILKCGTTYES
jgi:hypothetical protein